MLVGRIVVDDGVDRLFDGDLRLDGIEEADELLVAMALYVTANDSAIEDVKVFEQRGGAVTFVVVRHRPGTARLHWQPRLGTVERLDLAFLVDRENHRMGGRIDVEADDIVNFSTNFGYVDNLNVRMRCSASWWASRIRCSKRRLTPQPS